MKTNIPQTCLITGGCGFLGSNIAAHYLKLGSKVVIIDALFRVGGEQNLDWLKSIDLNNNLVFVKGDLADESIVNNTFKNHGQFDYICHLGGQVAMTTSLSDPRRDMLTNVVGTFNILEATRKFSPDALVAYSSTNKVYGDLLNVEYVEHETRFQTPHFPNGFDESTPLDFASPYGCSKGSADQYMRDWFRNYGVRTVIFRHSSIYGGRQFSTYDQGWIGWFCQKAIAQKKYGSKESFSISGTGKQVRDVLHAEDLIRLYQKAYECRENIAGEIFNIGGGLSNSLSILELFQLLEDLLEIPKPLIFEKLEARKSDQLVFVANISKANQFFDWKPSVTAKDGIASMLKWSESLLT